MAAVLVGLKRRCASPSMDNRHVCGRCGDLVCLRHSTPMIPFEPMSLDVLWYQIWRQHVRDAQRHPGMTTGYCRAAVIAQMEYVTHLALAVNEWKKKQ